jgi:hypothetical protein
METFIGGAIVALVSVTLGFVGCCFFYKKLNFVKEAEHTKQGEKFRKDNGLLSWKKNIPDEE